MKQEPDQLLKRFEQQWKESEDMRTKAYVLRREAMYVKKRYGDAAIYAHLLSPKVEQLEKDLCKLFDFVTGVIADVRRSAKDSGKSFGTGLTKKPTGKDLKAVRAFKGPEGVAGVDELGEIDPDNLDDDEYSSDDAQDANGSNGIISAHSDDL